MNQYQWGFLYMPQTLVSGGTSRLLLYRKADSCVERCSLPVGDKLKGTGSGDFKIAHSAVIRAPQQMLQSQLGLQHSVQSSAWLCARALGSEGQVRAAFVPPQLGPGCLTSAVYPPASPLEREDYHILLSQLFCGEDTEGQAT